MLQLYYGQLTVMRRRHYIYHMVLLSLLRHHISAEQRASEAQQPVDDGSVLGAAGHRRRVWL